MRHSIPLCPAPEAGGGLSASLAEWERLTREALAAQSGGRLEIALAGHVRALWTAEALLDDPALLQRPDDCLAALVVSHHNLSDLYRCRGQSPQAVEHLCLPHRLLMRLIEDGAQPPEVQQAAWRHARETRAQMLAWLRNHGDEPAVEAALHAAPPPAFPARGPHLH